MRGSVWVIVSVLVVATAGCSRQPKTAAPPPAAATPAPAPASTTMPVSPATETAPATPAAAELPPPPPPPREEAVRYSRADYGARERRLEALIANAETRDTTGETQYRARQGQAERQRCTTRACVERSYAVEEAWMRKWEGSGDTK